LRPSAQRYSIATVWPSIQPSSRSRFTKALVHEPQLEHVPAQWNRGDSPGRLDERVYGIDSILGG